MSFFDELKRRKVFRVAAGYIVAAWVLAQVADLIADAFNAPDRVMQMVITLLILGLPVSLLLSWAFDLTTDGLRRTEAGETEGTLVVGRKSILAIVSSLFVGLAVVLFTVWPRGDRSIAILPFEDFSPAADQAYLGNGIADELRLELQRLDGLRVAGRTSSNAYASEGNRSIGEMLDVETVLEGSVRKEGDNVRITVQLMDVDDGFTIWSESYNRELEEIFEMQEDIATEVAARLGVSLGVGGINSFRGAGTQNIEAYEAYLRARSQWYTVDGVAEAIPLLERAVQLDPEYAVAWAELAISTLNNVWHVGVDEGPEVAARAYQLGLRAVELDPESADVKSSLALIKMNQFDWIGAEQDNLQAIELLSDRLTIERYGLMLLRSGRSSEAEAQFFAAVAAEPLDGQPHGQIWHVYLAQSRFDEAQQILDWHQGNDLFEDNLDIAFSRRDPEAIKATIREMPESYISYVNLYQPLLAAFDAPASALPILQDVYRDESLVWPRKLHDIALAAAYFDETEFALEVKGKESRVNPVRLASIWDPVMSEVRKLDGFKDLVRELNLVEYWRTYGWADACRPLGDSDFECS